MSSWFRYPFSPPPSQHPKHSQIVNHFPATILRPEKFAEVDPTGRYGRYKELVGAGEIKKVYRAFDHETGMEVAWNQVQITKRDDNSSNWIHSSGDHHHERTLFKETTLLEFLNHESIVTLFTSWVVDGDHTLNFITELCNSGDLRCYLRKHPRFSIKAVKSWAKQILEGLEYLHDHDPCVIHGDLNCSNIFVNGNLGKVKIGDFTMASILRHGESACMRQGSSTPENMAPEYYEEEEYNELVDIYAFGLCVLEMVTIEIPYSECNPIDKIRKITSGEPPAALAKVKNPAVKAFIGKCLSSPLLRPSAAELLDDPFFLYPGV